MGGQSSQLSDQQRQEQQMIKYIQMGMESCPSKLVISGVMGAGLGAMFGIVHVECTSISSLLH